MEVSQLFSQPLQRLAEGTLWRVARRSAVGCETEDRRKNPHDVVDGRLAMSTREGLAIQPAVRMAGKKLFARRRSPNLTSVGQQLATGHFEARQKLYVALPGSNAALLDAGLLV